jgi:hypothetical protein
MSPPSRRARSREIDSPSPVPPYLRCVLPSACRNASKMTPCCCGDADAGVAHGERDSAPWAPGETRAATPPPVGELQGVRQQVLEDLPERCGRSRCVRRASGLDDARSAGPSAGERLNVGPAPRRRASGTGSASRSRLAGLDLRQIEDVVDQRQQIVAGRRDRLRELDLLGVRLPSCCRRAAWRGSATS